MHWPRHRQALRRRVCELQQRSPRLSGAHRTKQETKSLLASLGSKPRLSPRNENWEYGLLNYQKQACRRRDPRCADHSGNRERSLNRWSTLTLHEGTSPWHTNCFSFGITLKVVEKYFELVGSEPFGEGMSRSLLILGGSPGRGFRRLAFSVPLLSWC